MHKIDKLKNHNFRVFMKDGPRLTTKYKLWVEGRDRANKRVLLGGLGGMGVGQMWFEEEGNEHYPGFDTAPEVACNDRFGINVENEHKLLNQWIQKS